MLEHAGRFLDLAREGRTAWWRFVLGFATVGFFWLVLGHLSFQLVAEGAWFGAATDFVGVNLGIIMMLAGLLVAVRVVHRRPLMTLVAPDRRLDWQRVLQGAAVWSVLALTTVLLESLLYPDRYRLTFDYARFLPFLALVLLLTPIQCLTEELLFRGYLMQGIGLVTRRPLAAAVGSAALFTLVHLENPEVGRYGLGIMAANYFAIGLLFAIVTLRDGRLELAIGMHASNNMLLALFANYDSSALSTAAVLTATELDGGFSLAMLAAGGAAFYWWVFVRGSQPGPYSLTRAEREQFERDGYVVVRRLAPRELCERMRAAALADLADRVPPLELEADTGYPGAPRSRDSAGGATVRRLLQAVDRDAVWREWATSPAVAGRLRCILGLSPQLARAHHNCVMTKSPGYSSVTGWHRDIRYWSFERQELVSVWTALGPERRENGCLLVLPGTHRVEVDPGLLDDAQFLRTDARENRRLIDAAVPVELGPGDVLFFHCRLFHAAGRNETGETKLSPVFTYHASDNRPLPGSRSASLPSLPV